MKKGEYVIVGTYNDRKKWTFYTFILIIAFVFLFFPFFAVTWRYKVGKTISLIFDTIGSICLVIGGLYTFLGVIGVFTGGRGSINRLIIGIILLYIGCWLTGTVLEFMGIKIGKSDSSQGYN